MIYDKAKAARMLAIVLEVTDAALDLARPGVEPQLRIPAMDIEKEMRSLAAKGDVDGMYHEYVRFLQSGTEIGAVLERHHRKSLESEFYRLFKIYLEPGERP